MSPCWVEKINPRMTRRDQIVAATNKVRELLLEKNDAYGDSALSPLNIFSSARAEYGIRQRIDDKLKRIKNAGLNDETEDTLLDLVGYLILLIIARDEGHDLQNDIRKEQPRPDHSATSTTANQGRGVSYHS
jgi:hypothetical protein